jgi:endonuclease-3
MTIPDQAKVQRVTDRLRQEYGHNAPRTGRNPTDSLIATILSQHTADRNSHEAFRRLKERFGSWEEIARADVAELAATIRVAGLGNLKAVRIQQALSDIQERFGTMDLSFLKELPLEEARQVLLSLPGVGPKTAACVLLFSCGLPALPVDTHVHRLARRLGLIGEKESAEGAHRVLQPLVPPSDVYDFHVNLIRHGRTVCFARNPQCGACILQDECSYCGQPVESR